MIDFEFVEFVAAVGELDTEKILLFIKNGMDANYKTEENGNTLLTFALRNFSKKVSSILFDENENITLDEIGEKAMATISVLLKNGADLNFANRSGYTPLFFAIESFGEKISVIPLKKKSNEEQIAALEMIAPKVISLISILLKNGANANCETLDGGTPLGCVKYYLYFGMLSFLPSAMDGNIGEKKTAMKTLSKILDDIEGLLVGAGADMNRLNKFGETPRQYADRIMFGKLDKKLPPERNSATK